MHAIIEMVKKMEEKFKLNKTKMEKLKKIELAMLIELDRICRKNNIKYNLCGGTLIGAIRHNGFIPWDDDIDVCMLRDDYNKFIKIQEKELNNKYYFQNMETEKEYVNIFSKIRRNDSIFCESISNLDEKKQGIWIDIFPIDNTSDNMLIAKFYMLKVIILRILIAYKNGDTMVSENFLKRFLLRLLKFFSKFYSKKKLKNKLLCTIHKFNGKKTSNVVSYGGCYLFKEIVKREYFENLIEHKFEKHDFYIPKKYDEYLRNYYGNYMQLPPKEKQISNHYISKLQFPKE